MYQLPGWLVAVAAALLLHRWDALPVWASVALVVSWMVKDAALYPFLRASYEPDTRRAIERLVGLGGVAVEPLTPRGYVRVRGELWLASATINNVVIARGRAVTVDAVRGTILLVRPNLTMPTDTRLSSMTRAPVSDSDSDSDPNTKPE
jgi:membrane protein implicated in regulation of membrane protease activity